MTRSEKIVVQEDVGQDMKNGLVNIQRMEDRQYGWIVLNTGGIAVSYELDVCEQQVKGDAYKI